MPSTSPADGTSRHLAAQLLLIDDDPLMIALLSEMLSQYPNRRTATSSSEGIRLARELAPDLILLDVGMPDLDGIDTCGVLRADAKLERRG